MDQLVSWIFYSQFACIFGDKQRTSTTTKGPLAPLYPEYMSQLRPVIYLIPTHLIYIYIVSRTVN
uniref:Uncharacterized protein n=1 Tax=Anguilla anguilla TaxID=7936 RepID=A0A0E9PQN7_ANGAN